jgi:hypothetical protein
VTADQPRGNNANDTRVPVLARHDQNRRLVITQLTPFSLSCRFHLPLDSSALIVGAPQFGGNFLSPFIRFSQKKFDSGVSAIDPPGSVYSRAETETEICRTQLSGLQA